VSVCARAQAIDLKAVVTFGLSGVQSADDVRLHGKQPAGQLQLTWQPPAGFSRAAVFGKALIFVSNHTYEESCVLTCTAAAAAAGAV
jgi:hypothetical protein